MLLPKGERGHSSLGNQVLLAKIWSYLMLVELLLNCNYFILYVSDIWDFKSLQIKEVYEY